MKTILRIAMQLDNNSHMQQVFIKYASRPTN